jgi:general nucleoside transport system ATP-binding protein
VLPRAIEVRAVGASRWFGDCVSVRDASVTLAPGVIHAIVGENGAGKTTLLKMMAGALSPSSGEIWVGSSMLSPATPGEAIRRGVGLVYQHFSLVDSMSGLENLMLGSEPVGRCGVLRPAGTRRMADEVAARTGLRVTLDVPVGRLSVGERQRLEILRVLTRGARVLLLDEPTAVLTPREAADLYALLRRVADDGATVAVVTHHLAEVVAHADELTVMRRGEVVHHGSTSGLSVAEIGRLALGNIPDVPPPAPPPSAAPVLLRLERASTQSGSGGGAGGTGQVELAGVDLEVRAGEVVGVAGVDGNGQDALVAAIAGLLPLSSGVVSIAGRALGELSVMHRRELGLETIHGDRHRFGILGAATIADNLVLGDRGLVDERAAASRRLDASGAVPRELELPASALSGGNQQKLVVARALDRKPSVLVAAYPTRGIDAAAAAEVQRCLVEAAAAGAAVLVVSGDLGELRAVAHRLLVLFQGRVVAELSPGASEDEIGGAMLGGPLADQADQALERSS